MNKPLLLIADADVIIAQAYVDDALYEKTVQLGRKLAEKKAHILFPSTAIAEAITTIQRKLSNPSLAATTLDFITGDGMEIENVGQEVIKEAKKLFNPKGSRQNTLFDCIVATLAKKHYATAIFSFDDWYEKLGFTLALNLFKE